MTIDRILVIGGGIGGLAAARALRLKKVAVDLVEREQGWTVYGVGIIQPNNALRALERIGLADQCLANGAPFANWRVHDAAGNVLADPAPHNEAAPHMPPNNGITRPKLHRILVQGAQDAGVDIRLGTNVTAMQDDGTGVDIKFSDGDARRYDIVLGFDGMFSETRRELLGSAEPRFNGQGVWRCNMPRPSSVDTGMIFFGPDTKVGLVPMSPTLMYMLIVTAEPDNRWYDGAMAAVEMRSRLKGYSGLVEQLSAQITDPQEVVYRPMMTLLLEKWHKGRILLLGDAVHSTTPHLAQGAAMAIEDGILLAEMVASGEPVDTLFDSFTRRRYPRIKYVIDSCAQLTEWELESWRGVHNPDADQGGLLHGATLQMMTEY